MIKYLGSKRLLLPAIIEVVRSLGPDVRTVLDPFSGTARVGHALKREGYRVVSSDHNAYAEALARTYVEADRQDLLEDAQRLVTEMSTAPARAGWFTATYAEASRYFKPENAARIEGMREWIRARSLDPVLESVLLVSLMEAADRVDSTVGVQMAYLKTWARRAHNAIEPRVPDLAPRPTAGRCEAHRLDALVAAQRFEVDVAYLDPPYNQHSYLGNYHVWETLVRWDEPAVFGVAKKRVEVQQRKSDFNFKSRCREALGALLDAVRARWIVLSFSDEGHVAREELEAMLRHRGEVTTLAIPHPRYVGAKIGIHNPAGQKVGTVGKLANVEHLFVVGPRA